MNSLWESDTESRYKEVFITCSMLEGGCGLWCDDNPKVTLAIDRRLMIFHSHACTWFSGLRVRPVLSSRPCWSLWGSTSSSWRLRFWCVTVWREGNTSGCWSSCRFSSSRPSPWLRVCGASGTIVRLRSVTRSDFRSVCFSPSYMFLSSQLTSLSYVTLLLSSRFCVL